MTIYIDIDDVLCETAATLCVLAERAFGKGVPYERVRAFDLQQVFGLTDDEMRRFSVLSHEPECLLSYPQTPGAVEGVRSLCAAGHRVTFVTGRPAFAWCATEEWLARAGLGGIPVVYVDKYGRPYEAAPDEPQAIPLADFLQQPYDVAIDDSPVILPHLATWTKSRILVMDRPWNATYKLAANMTRVKGWNHILKTLMSCLERR